MAVYSPGRRRAILLLVLTSLLLITIDLRGNALLDAARDGFDRAMRPFEDAAEVVARPVRNAWRGITEYDDLKAENERLEAEIDAMQTNDIVARSVIDSWRRLLGMEDLESPGDFDRVVASVIGQSPNNLDLIIEINKGTNDGIRVGMPVVNPAGSLIGKITQATSDRAQVMLLIDTNYAVLVKIVRPEPLPSAGTTTTTAPAPPPAAERRGGCHDDVNHDDDAANHDAAAYDDDAARPATRDRADGWSRCRRTAAGEPHRRLAGVRYARDR